MYATEGYSITEKQVCAGGEMNKVILLLIFDGRDKRLTNSSSDNPPVKSPRNLFCGGGWDDWPKEPTKFKYLRASPQTNQ